MAVSKHVQGDVNVSEMIKIALTYANVKEDVHCNILNVKICGLVVLGTF